MLVTLLSLLKVLVHWSFLPPYSPDLNAIEEAFSSVKAYLKANEAVLQATDDIEDVLTAAFATITLQHCQAWIKHAGY